MVCPNKNPPVLEMKYNTVNKVTPVEFLSDTTEPGGSEVEII